MRHEIIVRKGSPDLNQCGVLLLDVCDTVFINTMFVHRFVSILSVEAPRSQFNNRHMVVSSDLCLTIVDLDTWLKRKAVN